MDKRSRGRDDSSSSSDSDTDDFSKRRRKRSSSTKTRHTKGRRRHHHRHHRDEMSDRSDPDTHESSSSLSENHRSHRRRKKGEKKEKKRDKKTSKRREKRRDRANDHSHAEGSTSADEPGFRRRNAAIADGLLRLLSDRPAFSSELPIIMIRLAGGTSFDLSQMTDEVAARGLARVFASLESLGVRQDPSSRCWVWESPQQAAGGSRSGNDLLILRVIRSVLDQMGLTTQAVDAFDERLRQKRAATALSPATASQQEINTLPVQRLVTSLLLQHDSTNQLASELASLGTMILEGESVALDGLPDEKLRKSLEQLFEACGLVKSDMEFDEDDGENETAVLGYALPEVSENASRAKLEAVLSVCQDRAKSSRRPVQGPLMDPSAYASARPKHESSSEDEGPAPEGSKRKAPSLSADQMKAQAARRAIELECAKAGIAPPPETHGEGFGGREEWMLVPGNFDFLGSIKAGQPMKSRTFEGKQSKTGAESSKEKTMDPSIQAEIDEIMHEHEKARGPSLMEVHLQKKAEESKQTQGKKAPWQWSRDKDLDAGRNVDKNALKMVLGGASSDLKNKFHGGFS